MAEIHNGYAAVPEHLRKQTIETMPFDTPYYVTIERDMSDREAYSADKEESLWVDETTGRLETSIDVKLDDDDRECAKSALDEQVPIMRVEVLDEQLRIHQGLIADLRYVNDGVLSVYNDDEPPEDQEYFQDWVDIRRNKRGFAAIATLEVSQDVTPRTVLSGDPIFHDALRYLMTQTDALPDDLTIERDENVNGNEKREVSKRIKAIFGKIARRNG